MRVLGFWTRKYQGDTVVAEWNSEIVALDRVRLEKAVGYGVPIEIIKGDLLPSKYFSTFQPQKVELPVEVLRTFHIPPDDTGTEPGTPYFMGGGRRYGGRRDRDDR